ncbi:hypothetical protein CLOLEP_02084 [[Clostridium] leptum DSM 753]|uniref:Uncharacterized protein n=1 Tax=[Clostridium] leptum DSM 753 TaxID=428125 RepID=A7VU38_9FIRM|nr:hypothetical protein CLOLEP_02084 [[Clostridium] leptum DSM 753]
MVRFKCFRRLQSVRTGPIENRFQKEKEPVDFPPALILRLLNIFSFQKFKILYFLFGC